MNYNRNLFIIEKILIDNEVIICPMSNYVMKSSDYKSKTTIANKDIFAVVLPDLNNITASEELLLDNLILNGFNFIGIISQKNINISSKYYFKYKYKIEQFIDNITNNSIYYKLDIIYFIKNSYDNDCYYYTIPIIFENNDSKKELINFIEDINISISIDRKTKLSSSLVIDKYIIYPNEDVYVRIKLNKNDNLNILFKNKKIKIKYNQNLNNENPLILIYMVLNNNFILL